MHAYNPRSQRKVIMSEMPNLTYKNVWDLEARSAFVASTSTINTQYPSSYFMPDVYQADAQACPENCLDLGRCVLAGSSVCPCRSLAYTLPKVLFSHTSIKAPNPVEEPRQTSLSLGTTASKRSQHYEFSRGPFDN